MNTNEILRKFEEIASSPKKLFQQYLSEGKKVVLCAPLYTPEEILHSMGIVPMGVWGADIEVVNAKKYFPAFICNVYQTFVELGMRKTFDGASAIIIPLLSDSLKATGENWKYAVPDIPYIPLAYPQNRKPKFGIDFTYSKYKYVISELERITGLTYNPENLKKSIEIYNEHNQVMRDLKNVLLKHPEITVANRNHIYKSAFFINKEEHTKLVKDLINNLKNETVKKRKTKLYASGLLFDGNEFLQIFDDLNIQIVGDDIGSESRQYRTDTILTNDPLYSLAEKFGRMDECSFLYDVNKDRVNLIIKEVKETKAEGIIVILTKFCDSEEFDYVMIKQQCEKHDIPLMLVEVDRQMVNYEQAKTLIQTFVENL